MQPFVQLIVRWLVLALGVAVATKIIPGLRCDDLHTLLVVAVVLSALNALLRPLLLLVALPFIVLTLGFGVVLINTLLFYLTSRLVSGFEVAGFWPALGGALVVSFTSWVLGALLKSPPRPPPGGGASPGAGPRRERPGADVIDI